MKTEATSIKYQNTSPELGSAQNLNHSDYWSLLPEVAGPDYEQVAQTNFTELTVLQTALQRARGTSFKGGHLSRSEVASEWYYKLGTHNSLHGARDDLLTAARLVCSAKGSEPIKTADLLGKLKEDDPGIKVSDKLLAMQMIIDAVRDPSPSRGEGTNVTATDLTLLNVVKEGADKITSRLHRHAGAKVSRGERLDDSQKRELSDAFKFYSEARFMRLNRIPDEQLAVDLKRRQEKLLPSSGNPTQSPQDKIIQSMEGTGDLRAYILLNEVAQQTGRLQSFVEPYLTNGDLTEHYFSLLMRHAALTTEDDARTTISATTARQDCPHDGMRPGGRLPRLSHDTLIERPDGTTYFVQLKAKTSDQPENYHRGIVEIDLYGTTRSMNDVEIRQEARTGLRQLHEAATEVVTGKLYEGSFSMLEKHVRTINDKLLSHEDKRKSRHR